MIILPTPKPVPILVKLITLYSLLYLLHWLPLVHWSFQARSCFRTFALANLFWLQIFTWLTPSLTWVLKWSLISESFFINSTLSLAPFPFPFLHSLSFFFFIFSIVFITFWNAISSLFFISFPPPLIIKILSILLFPQWKRKLCDDRNFCFDCCFHHI